MTDFLLELRSEEIPARMQKGARADLEKLFVAHLAGAGLKADSIVVWSTPRRLTLIARGLPEQTQAVKEERKGPRADAPAQALEGFLRSTGLTRDQLEEREDKKGGTVLFAVIDRPGRATREVLAEAIPAIIRAFPWPKSQRWGAASLSTESLRWVRPLSGIVAIFGDDLVACEVDGIASGYATIGHRFHAPHEVTIGGVGDYQEKLRACHVIVDQAEREAMIRDGAVKAAADAGLVLVTDEGLVVENAGLTEWPVPLLGSFDPAFLEVPEEVIQLTARINQKYFICRTKDGALAPNFVCTANISAHDGGKAIVAGNEKVLAARLSDARHFWEVDQWHFDPATHERTSRKTLDQHGQKLANIVFHEKLGTVADKVKRVAALAEWLAREGIVPNCDPALARQAAELCKADLVTEMVGEFPELQGVMGGYYARAQGLPDAVADAIRDHYKPVGQGDDVPTAPVTVAVSLADKLDTLLGFFLIGLPPTGSKDPFALRRTAIAILQIGNRLSLRYSLSAAIDAWVEIVLSQFDHKFSEEFKYLEITNVAMKAIIEECEALFNSGKTQEAIALLRVNEISDWSSNHDAIFDNLNEKYVKSRVLYDEINSFFADRLKVQQKEAGVRHDLIDAVFALGGEDDLVRLLARVKALQSFMETEDGKNLHAGYKRAANILKKEVGEGDVPTGVNPAPEPAEAALIAALDDAEPKAAAAVAEERFGDAMAALASLRAPIDAFFDAVTVNDADADKRAARLALLARIRAAVHNVADFTKIEG